MRAVVQRPVGARWERRSRRVLCLAALVVAILVVASRGPISLLDAGSPGTDAGADAVQFGSLPEFVGLAWWLVAAAWVVLGLAAVMGTNGRRVVEWPLVFLSGALATVSLVFAGRGVWLFTTMYEVAQPGDAAVLLWRFSTAAVCAVCCGAMIAPAIGPNRRLAIVARIAGIHVPAISIVLVVGLSLQTAGSVGSRAFASAVIAWIGVIVGAGVAALRSRARPLSGTLARPVFGIGIGVAVPMSVLHLATMLTSGAGITVADVIVGPALFLLMSLVPLAAARDRGALDLE